MPRLVAATDSWTDWKHEAFRVACSERVNCVNFFRSGSSNWLLTRKHCACAFVIIVVLIASLSM